MADQSESTAQHSSDEEGRGKDASRAAGTDGETCGQHLEKSQGQEDLDGELPVDGLLNPAVPHAQDLGKEKTEDTEEKPAQGRLEVIFDGDSFKEVPQSVKHFHVQSTRQRTEDAQKDVEDEFNGMGELELGEGEEFSPTMKGGEDGIGHNG